MRRFSFSIFAFLSCLVTVAQPLPDTVKAHFNKAQTIPDKGRVLIDYIDLNTDRDSIINYLYSLRSYFDETKQPELADYMSVAICRQLARGAGYTEALNDLFQLLPRFEKRKDQYGVLVCTRHFSYAYYTAGDKDKTLHYDRKTVDLSVASGNKYDIAVSYNNLAADMSEYGYFDSAVYYARNAVQLTKELDNPLLLGKTLSTMAESYLANRKYDSSHYYSMQALSITLVHSPGDYLYGLNDLAELYLARNVLDSTIFYATLAVPIAHRIKVIKQELRSYQYLYTSYQQTGPIDSAYKYLQLVTLIKDSLYNDEHTKEVQLITGREQKRQEEVEQQKVAYRNQIKMYALIAGIVVISIIGLILYRNSKKDKAAKLLLLQKNEVIEKTLEELKATQSQLIQSEKMASLGELTAGIAHEIQNPLNFVNNFSEVSNELMDEMSSELDKGDITEAKNIANDIRSNLEKITHHGKRADAIVKGMLQHSRSGSGQKEPTDINALCDEYLRLSYHGFRAKEKSFNAKLVTEFDNSIGKVMIIPQEIGRVLMNLLVNAFYAVNEKARQGETDYAPTVSVTTKNLGGSLEIRISDNGNGIPQNIIDKIFQPFFTTKPTGEGTGLGLSLTYDIIKAHGGELKVETMEREGANFLITLPTQS